MSGLSLSGVIPATLLCFNDDLSIDEASSRKHLSDVANVSGISAITVNGHASEVGSCSFEEQARILDFSLDEAGDQVPIISGVYADGSLEAASLAKAWERAGASALLVFPSNVLGMGGFQRPEMANEHFKYIADATDLPLIAFVYPVQSNLHFTFDGLVQLFDEVPSVKAIKDWCNDPKRHERHIREFQSRSDPVNVLTTHSSWLMSSLSLGAAGLLSGAGSVVAPLQLALFEAIQRGDFIRAREVNDILYPFQQVFYADPFLDMHNRMKHLLYLNGRVPNPMVRPPMMALQKYEVDRLKGLTRLAEDCGGAN
ncbi:dihydrodipicolinate synthase family protein [Roseovarius sp. 2305UL8-3]|uniref:dihydrodipicolinate synthase family protein n=1 Tax=Roseovarius conchicola TaxID=3121636 RepID=UPI0035270A8B